VRGVSSSFAVKSFCRWLWILQAKSYAPALFGYRLQTTQSKSQMRGLWLNRRNLDFANGSSLRVGSGFRIRLWDSANATPAKTARKSKAFGAVARTVAVDRPKKTSRLLTKFDWLKPTVRVFGNGSPRFSAWQLPYTVSTALFAVLIPLTTLML